MDSLEMRCIACELEASEASEGSEADAKEEEGGVSNIVVLLIVMGVVVIIIIGGVVAFKRSKSMKKLIEKFSKWKSNHRQKLDLFYAQVTVVVVVVDGGSYGWRVASGGWRVVGGDDSDRRAHPSPQCYPR